MRKGLIGFARAMRALALVIGGFVLLSVAIEVLPSLPRKARLLHADLTGRALTPPVDVTAYKGADWVDRYWYEDRMARSFRWEPYVYWRMKPYAGETLTVDARGLRRTVHPYAPPGGKAVDVWTFGGSTMWGFGVPDRYTIASDLAAALADPRVAVTNYGENGWVATQSLLMLMMDLRAGRRPDVVVFYDGYNDTYATAQGLPPGTPMNEFRRRAEFGLSLFEERGRTYLQALQFAYYSTWKAARNLGQSLATDAAAPGAEAIWSDAEGVVDAYAFLVDRVRDLAAAYGFTPLFVWQPIPGVDPGALPEPGAPAVAEDGLTGRARAVYRLAHARFAGAADVVFLDGLLPPDAPVYLDYVHLSPDGNRAVAEALAPLVAARLPGAASDRPTEGETAP
jgi:lysophospholipase L1-like esterase